jgi:hypothetical protein
LVINYRQADLSDTPTFFISNRLVWQAAGITRIRRHRWPVEALRVTRKARRKGWMNINCGTLAPFNAMLRWSP